MGICLDGLKYANIIPCFKKGDVTEIANYRPISLLRSFSKLFEILVFSRLKQHLVSNDILAPEQYGFHKDVSMQTAVFNLTDTVLEAWNNKEFVVGVFFYLTRAFDCVSHDLLILLRAYNSDTTVSEWKAVRFGVPQASVLGHCCLMFILMISQAL
jgi:hypothetical protein